MATSSSSWRALTTLAVAIGGATALTLLGVPAAALLGATIAVTLATALRFEAVVPNALRDVGFTTIGVMLGVGVTPAFFTDVARFPMSLAVLAVTMTAVIVLGRLMLQRRFATERDTATLAMSPGALSYTLALATANGAAHRDVATITVVQSLRLLLITLLLPPLVTFTDSPTAHTAATPLDTVAVMELTISLLLIGLAWSLGFGCRALRVPAPFLMSGLLLSGLGHGIGLLEGRPATVLTFVGFSIAGAVVGSRFASIDGRTLRRHLRAGVAATALALSLSGIVSLFVAGYLDMPFGQVWVAFAPGGVEAMSAMALSLDYDPVYVATHHIFRLLLLMVLLPWLLRRPT